MKKNIIIFKKFHSKSFGFTLIELLVVVGILSVMAASLLVTLNPYTQIQKANDSKRKADLSQIQKALESYYQDNSAYPAQSASGNYMSVANWEASWIPYMNVVPKDSNASYNYIYYSTPDLQSYYLYASLERGSKDPQACSGGLSCSSPEGSGINMDTACGSKCNYGVSTPDKNP